jgi:hypothetical protein
MALAGWLGVVIATPVLPVNATTPAGPTNGELRTDRQAGLVNDVHDEHPASNPAV